MALDLGRIDKAGDSRYNILRTSPRGGTGIRGRLRTCARKGVEVQILSGALKEAQATTRASFSVVPPLCLAVVHPWFVGLFLGQCQSAPRGVVGDQQEK
mgnify:CR=1 FL=1